MTIGEGTTDVFTNSLSLDSLKGRTYATAAEQTDWQFWNQSEPNARYYNLGPNGTDNDGSVTFLLKAERGVFKGGKVKMRGTTFPNGAMMALQTHNYFAYATTGSPAVPTGVAGHLPDSGALYSEDNHAPSSAYSFSDWEVNVPANTNQFYVTIAARHNWSSAWAQYLKAEDITIQVPPLNVAFETGKMPLEWKSWTPWQSLSYQSGLTTYESFPSGGGYFALRHGATVSNSWRIYTEDKFPVEPESTWTFTAMVYARNLGWLCNDNSHGMILYTDGDAGVDVGLKVFDTVSFGWTSVHYTYTNQTSTTKYVQPGFFGKCGGEIFITDISFEKAPTPMTLTVPTHKPVFSTVDISPVVSEGGQNGIYEDGETISWYINLQNYRTSAVPSPTLVYDIVDAYGNTYVSGGHTQLNATVTFVPQDRNYYELRIDHDLPHSDNDFRVGPVRIRASAAVSADISNLTWGANPFGLEGADTVISKRLGFSWMRPVYWNIAMSGPEGHYTFPTDTAAYRAAWTTKLNTEGLRAEYIRTFELWNEPINTFKPHDPTTGSAVWWDKYKKTIMASWEGIRSYDPTLKIAVNFEQLNHFFTFNNNYGGSSFYDIAMLHPYSPNIQKGIGRNGPEDHRLHVELEEAAIIGKDLWSTEFGWATFYSDCRPKWSVNELSQAQFVTRSTLIQLAGNLKKVMPYRWHDHPADGEMTGSFGLARFDKSPKPALLAYGVLAQTIHNLSYVGRFDMGHSNRAALVFSSGTNTVVAHWSVKKNNDDNTWNTTQYSLALPSSGTIQKKTTTMFGKPTVFFGSNVTITPGQSPIYLSIAASASEVATAMGKTLLTGAIPSTMFPSTVDVHAEFSAADEIPACPN